MDKTKKFMRTTKNNQNQLENSLESENILLDSIKVLSDLTRRDIEKFNNIKDSQNTEIYYYSN